jgi:hypothetical protein
MPVRLNRLVELALPVLNGCGRDDKDLRTLWVPLGKELWAIRLADAWEREAAGDFALGTGRCVA